MKKNMLSSLFDGALTLTIAALAVKIIGVLYKIPLSYILGDAGMGYFNTAYTVYGFFYVLCSAGVPKAITCIISEYLAKNEQGRATVVYKTALRFFTFLGSGICIVYLALTPTIASLINNERAMLTMLSIGPSILFVATGGVVRGYLSAVRRLTPIAISQVIEAVFKLCLGLLFARLGVYLRVELSVLSALAVLGITVGSAFSTLYLIIVAKNKLTENKPRQNIENTTKLTIRKIAKIAVPITLGSSVLTLSSVIDMGVIMRCLTIVGYSSEQANEIYGNYTTLSIPMFNLIISLVTPLTVYLLPELIKIHHMGDKTAFKSTLKKTVFVTSLFVCPCTFVFYYFSFDVLDVLFTSVQSVNGFTLLSTLSFGLILLSLLNVANTAHEATGRLRIPIISLLIGTLIKLMLEPYLIIYCDMGPLAIPLSTNASYFVSLTISTITLRKHGCSASVISSSVIPFVLSAVCFSVPYYTLYSQGITKGSKFGLFMLLFTSFAVYIGLLFVLLALKKIFTGVKLHKKTALRVN